MKSPIEQSKDLFNKFSEMSRTELAEMILNRLKEKVEGEEGAKHSSITAEMARALFVECCYSASLKNASVNNKELCSFYANELTDAYKTN